MAIKIYEYDRCSTCKKALKYLDEKKKKYERVPIVDKPPTVSELKTMLGYLKASGKTFKNLFNTSANSTRSLKIGDRIKAGMTEQEAIALLRRTASSSSGLSCQGRHDGLGWNWDEPSRSAAERASAACEDRRETCRGRTRRSVKSPH